MNTGHLQRFHNTFPGLCGETRKAGSARVVFTDLFTRIGQVIGPISPENNREEYLGLILYGDSQHCYKRHTSHRFSCGQQLKKWPCHLSY